MQEIESISLNVEYLDGIPDRAIVWRHRAEADYKTDLDLKDYEAVRKMVKLLVELTDEVLHAEELPHLQLHQPGGAPTVSPRDS